MYSTLRQAKTLLDIVLDSWLFMDLDGIVRLPFCLLHLGLWRFDNVCKSCIFPLSFLLHRCNSQTFHTTLATASTLQSNFKTYKNPENL